MNDPETALPNYPPAKHFMRDLRVAFEHAAGVRRLVVRLEPTLQNPAGTLDLGVAATLVDMQGGGDAILAVQPDWAVTSDMTLHLLRPVSSGVLCGRSRVIRAGRNNVVLEAELFVEGDEAPVAQGQLGFTRILRRADTPPVLADPTEEPARKDMGEGSSGFASSFYDGLGFRVVEPAAGALELGLTDYHRNSLGAMQGGLVVALASKAAETIGRERSGRPLVTTDLTAHYLAMAKVGPLCSRASVLREDADSVVSRIELRDAGAEHRLCSVATATARVFGPNATR